MPSKTNNHNTMTTIDISTLPDLCLLTIFDSVPLMELGNVFLTCHRWHSFRSWILARRTRLHLIIGKRFSSTINFTEDECFGPDNNNNKSSYDDDVRHLNTLTWSVLTAKRTQLLLNSFNHQLRHLVLELDCLYGYTKGLKENPNTSTLTNLSHLLHEWTSTKTTDVLQTIDLCMDTFYPAVADRSLVMRTIAGLGTRLRGLKLHFGLIRDYVRQRAPFPVLASLHRLELSSMEFALGDDLVEFCRWVGENYARNRRLSIILPLEKGQLFQSVVGQDHLEQIYQSGAPLAQFRGCFPEPELKEEENHMNPYDQMQRFVAHLPALTALSLTDATSTDDEEQTSRLTMAEMSRCLSRLPKLERLQFFYFSSELESTTMESQSYAPLKSVRQLTIHLYDEYTDEGVELRHLEHWNSVPHSTIFPGLRELCIRYENSQFESSESEDKEPALVPELQQVVRPYLTCPQLAVVRFIELELGIVHSYQPDQLKLKLFKV